MKGYSEDRQYFINLLYNKYAMPEEEILGCLGTGAEDTDYVLCEGDGDLLPTLYKKNEIRFEYNQGAKERSKKSCTVFAAMGMLSDLIDYEFSEDQIKEVDELTYTTDKYPKREKGKGYYVKYAVGITADWYNNSELSKKYGKVAYYRLSKYDNELIEDVIGKLYTIDGNYCPTTQFNQDYLLDGIVDGTDFGYQTNGHSVDVISKGGQRSVKNSYKGRKYNIFGLKNKLSALTNFGEYFYVYTLVKEDNLERIKKLNTIKALIQQALPINSELWKETGSQTHRNKLHDMNDFLRDRQNYIDNELKTLN